MMLIVLRLANIPIAYWRSDVARRLWAKFGTLVEVIPQKGDFVQIYFRVRVEANISKPLLCGVYLRIQDGSRKWITFSYERMPLYCYLCGYG